MSQHRCEARSEPFVDTRLSLIRERSKTEQPEAGKDEYIPGRMRPITHNQASQLYFTV